MVTIQKQRFSRTYFFRYYTRYGKLIIQNFVQKLFFKQYKYVILQQFSVVQVSFHEWYIYIDLYSDNRSWNSRDIVLNIKIVSGDFFIFCKNMMFLFFTCRYHHLPAMQHISLCEWSFLYPSRLRGVLFCIKSTGLLFDGFHCHR